MPFVSYLNLVFGNGGFPGRTAPDNQWQLKQDLARDLLPSEPPTHPGRGQSFLPWN